MARCMLHRRWPSSTFPLADHSERRCAGANCVFYTHAHIPVAVLDLLDSSLETRPSPSSKYYNTYAHAPYVNYAGVFFWREKAWKIFARDAWHDYVE